MSKAGETARRPPRNRVKLLGEVRDAKVWQEKIANSLGIKSEQLREDIHDIKNEISK